MMTMMVPALHNPSATNVTVGSYDDADIRLSELTENSLMISTTHEVTKFNTNNAVIHATKGGLYSNGLSNMTAAAIGGDSATHESASSRVGFSVPLGASSMPQTEAACSADVGLLGVSFPDSWNDWESNRRSESMSMSMNSNQKRHHQKQLRHRKQRIKTIDAKKVKAPSLASYRRQRLRLERSIGRHLKDAGKQKAPKIATHECEPSSTEVIPFQSSKSLRRRQRRRVVRFRDEDVAESVLEWKRGQQKGGGFGRGLGFAPEAPFLEAQRERKETQRSLLDLQVGMKCMGL